MYTSLVYKTDRPWPNDRLKRAAIVGHVDANRARLWLRTGNPGRFVLLAYAADNDPDDSLFQSFRTVPYPDLGSLPDDVGRIPVDIENYDHDATTVVDIERLEPDTEYRYALWGLDGDIPRILLGQDQIYRFRTWPEGVAPLSFAFYSCHMPYTCSLFGNTNIEGMEIWDAMNEVMERHQVQDFRYLIAGGDQVYADGVDTLNIWKYLNSVMRREDNTLHPSRDEMLSYYRDIYRGYWGFPALRKVYSRFPTYMIWDDHELGDGWGSYRLNAQQPAEDELDRIFPRRDEKGLNRDDALELMARMRSAAEQVYREYQHSHNPETPPEELDYVIPYPGAATYVLDGRSQRDINRKSYRILGKAQFNRFAAWLEVVDPAQTPFVFVVSTVPVLHMSPVLVNADDSVLTEWSSLQDDLRDAWEHKLHDMERRALLKALFAAAARGVRIAILSGDVHVSAAFRMTDQATGATIFQLTSSALTYNKPRLLGWLLGNTVPDEGDSDDGYHFERLALYTQANFGLLRVDPQQGQAVYQLYGVQQVDHPDPGTPGRPVTHAIAKIELQF
ncbi:MAG: alkaline phosphatase family protein [Hydrogenophaga sp.]|nr:alkaline phosphatase family protein [Hydrogenophaga sp.]